jgi:hypothetical protein
MSILGGDDRYRSRYAAEDPVSEEVRSAVWAEVQAAMERTFGAQRYTEGFNGGEIHRTSNGTPSGIEPLNRDGPGMSAAWRRRIEKARRDAAEHDREIRIRVAAAEIELTSIIEDVRTIKKWLTSLLSHQSAGG